MNCLIACRRDIDAYDAYPILMMSASRILNADIEGHKGVARFLVFSIGVCVVEMFRNVRSTCTRLSDKDAALNLRNDCFFVMYRIIT